ncbi:hypothetical protein RC083_12445 [Pseudoalteromonas haloplanktis]|uniref:Uncharacterized protein n=1 Tax=Pseudoalteromonas haloplanktis TaxID=228 RepID=A0ABU1BD23_PSEHA|nr:hypothetical protein [Pseudoalteromonas haloplanktis]MDQ9092398.1 hypothetical protein [Pseudoalteromonas haloplanktis]
MLAKPIYESIPYFYIAFGSFCMVVSSALLPTALGVLLFFNGANIWRLRSNARRKDHQVNRIRANKNFYYYEFKPFLLLIVGILVMRWIPYKFMYPVGVMICCCGLLILFLRILNRRTRSLV